MRTHVILPDQMVRDIDELVGKGKRSKFVEEAVQEKLRKERLLKALDTVAGAVSAEDHPEWATSESTARWVHEMRRRDTEHREAKLKRD